MSTPRNWTAVGLGIEVLAGVAILISPWLAIPIALGGAGVIAWGLYPEKIERAISKVLPGQIPNQDADPYIPLKEAATIFYEETRGTKVAEIAERTTDGDVLGYYAHALFDGNTTLYGNYPPSRKLEAVPNEEYGRCGFSNDYSALRRHGKSQNLYEGLQIKRSDVDRRIAELVSAASAPHEVRLSDALYWKIDNSDWGPGLGRDSFLDQAAIALRQAAKDGEITVRGRREIAGYHPDGQFDRTWSDIDRSYWETHEFEMTAVMDAEPHYATRETQVVSLIDNAAEALPHYAMLRVWNDELEKQWPKNGKKFIPPIISLDIAEETDTEVSTALLLIAELSSWMRWQDAQRIGDGQAALTDDSKINLAETMLRQRLEEGRLSARGRRRGALEYEKIPSDLWKIVYLDIQRDPRTLWRAKMTPRDGLEQEAIERIPDYVSIQVSEKQIKELWPAMDTRLDRESALLLKLAQTKDSE